jgi:hypothetical protein
MLHLPDFRQSVRLQGGVKFPTGGMQAAQSRLPASPRAPASPPDSRRRSGVSRSGAMPEPTVIVRMEEDVQIVMSVPVALPDGLGRVWAFCSNVSRGERCLFAMP